MQHVSSSSIEVQEGWQSKNLGELAEFINGRVFKQADWQETGVPIIRIQNLNGSNEFNYYQGEIEERHKIHNDDLLFSWSGSRGTSFGPHMWKGENGVLNQHIFKIKINKEESLDKYYFYYALKRITQLIEKDAHGSAGLVHITKKNLEGFSILVPSLQEQQKIASIILSVDETIEKTKFIIRQTEKVTKGLMQQLLIKGIGHTKFKKTEMGEIPEEWKVRTLGTIGTWSGGGTPSKQEPSYWSKDKQVIWVSPKDMYSNIITSSEDYITEKGLREKKLKLLPKGTILFVTRSGILRNRVPIALAGDFLTINQDLKALQVASNIDYDFIFYTLLALNDSIRTSCVKTGTTVESIDFQSLQEVLIPVPTLSEQKEIVKIIGTYYKKLENEKYYLEYLGSLKKGLLQLLLTGKVRVKVEEEEVKQV
ncbi:restriction endonuclease subunit S [Bacillus wiedmannii]|uniref:restriction endonuclease subunit S n=1 Tax=Bacillus wiedmannii TaxID=1890302 RepID=UPI001F4FBA69|nr:restriction endonuclease subunit S [Bacillus wiedmannii]